MTTTGVPKLQPGTYKEQGLSFYTFLQFPENILETSLKKIGETPVKYPSISLGTHYSVWGGQVRLFAPYGLDYSQTDIIIDLSMVCKFKFIFYSPMPQFILGSPLEYKISDCKIAY